MAAIFIDIHPENPQEKKIKEVVTVLKDGGLIIYPTDSVYNFGCALSNRRGIEKLAKLKGVKIKDAKFSLVFNTISEINLYTKQYSRSTFKLLNKSLPGPFTFILPASNHISRLFDSRKNEVGIRIPSNIICSSLLEELGEPIVTSSVREDDSILEYLTDPIMIYEFHKHDVDCIVSGGFGNIYPSTIIDCTDNEPLIIRQGAGEIDFL